VAYSSFEPCHRQAPQINGTSAWATDSLDWCHCVVVGFPVVATWTPTNVFLVEPKHGIRNHCLYEKFRQNQVDSKPLWANSIGTSIILVSNAPQQSSAAAGLQLFSPLATPFLKSISAGGIKLHISGPPVCFAQAYAVDLSEEMRSRNKEKWFGEEEDSCALRSESTRVNW
jgi:hypothetical protein